MFFSKTCFSSSSGTISKYMPNSNMFNLYMSSNVPTLYALMLDLKASLVKGYSNASDILNAISSQVLADKYKLACSICLVAVFEAFTANFCKPTREFLSG